MTYADLYTYAGVVAVEEAGGPKINFRLGREDEDSGEASPKTDNLPNADVGSRVHTTEHVRAVFYRMGFSDQEVRMQTTFVLSGNAVIHDLISVNFTHRSLRS